MANNLKKFTTEAEYSAATLSYPAVSWIVSGDTVHFDKSAPVAPNDKLMMAFRTGPSQDGQDIVLFNGSVSIEPRENEYFTSITLNDADVMSTAISNQGVLYNYTVAQTDYLAKYGISGATINDYFTGDLGGGFGSDLAVIDFLVPAQVTTIDHLPSNVINLVVEATTVPTVSFEWSDIVSLQGIYVPTESVNAYKTAWDYMASNIFPISQYSGNLPV